MTADRWDGAAGTQQVASPDILRDGIRAGEVGVWRWSVKTGGLVWSDNLEAIHRLPDGAFDGTFESFSRDIHPDDRDRVRGRAPTQWVEAAVSPRAWGEAARRGAS